jgi:hypothetical protein
MTPESEISFGVLLTRKAKSNISNQNHCVDRNNLIHIQTKKAIPGTQAHHETSPLSTPDRITNQSMENLTCSDQKLSLFLTYARSLLRKVEDLESTMSLNGVSLAFITETWLNDNIDDAAVHIPNYSVARRDRVSRTGGGVCAFVKSYIPFKVLTGLHDDNFETLWLHIRPHKLFRGFSCLIVCVAYNPPSSDIKRLSII